MHTLFSTFLLIACGNKNQEDTSTDEAVVENTEPTQPDSVTIQTSGTESLSLMFDTPSCQIPSAAPNFNAFWRNGGGAHVFVLRVMIRGDYTGAGTYTSSDNELLVTLQEEAGGQGRYYALDEAQGDTATVTLNTDTEGIVWGTLTVNSLHNLDGSISISPTEIPLWCDSENTAGLEQGQ